MVKMKTTSNHEYANRKLVPGDEFEAEDAHVVLLEGLGRAARVPLEVKPSEVNTPLKELIAVPATSATASKATYRTRNIERAGQSKKANDE